jgi:hypothetical protein
MAAGAGIASSLPTTPRCAWEGVLTHRPIEIMLPYLDDEGIKKVLSLNRKIYQILRQVGILMLEKAFMRDLRGKLEEREIKQFNRVIHEHAILIASEVDNSGKPIWIFLAKKLCFVLENFFDFKRQEIIEELQALYPFSERLFNAARLNSRRIEYIDSRNLAAEVRKLNTEKRFNLAIMKALKFPLFNYKAMALGAICFRLLEENGAEKVGRIFRIIHAQEFKIDVVKSACNSSVMKGKSELVAVVFRCSLTKEEEKGQILYDLAKKFIDQGKLDEAITIARLPDCRLWKNSILRAAIQALEEKEDFERALEVSQMISESDV